jgi:predicted adenylyl cyclase CyaB
MRKVIVKCKVHDRERFEKKLEDVGLEFSPVYWQYDRVYVPRGYKGRSNFLRLIMRTEMHAIDDPPAYLLSLLRHIEDSGIDVVEETSIKDYENTVNIILQLGFKPAGEVSRRRQDLKMGEGTYIYLDKIETQPGYYAKIESNLAANDSVAAAKSDLQKTFETLGESNFVENSYFEL